MEKYDKNMIDPNNMNTANFGQHIDDDLIWKIFCF